MAALCLVGLASCATAAGVEPPAGPTEVAALAEEGRMVAVAQCSSCHAIDHFHLSPDKRAPPMSRLLSRYDPEMLSDDLIEGIRVGHDEMPHFDFDIRETDALVAYLKSISEPPWQN